MSVIYEHLKETPGHKVDLTEANACLPALSDDDIVVVNRFMVVSLEDDEVWVQFEDYLGEYKMTIDHFTIDELDVIINAL